MQQNQGAKREMGGVRAPLPPAGDGPAQGKISADKR